MVNRLFDYEWTNPALKGETCPWVTKEDEEKMNTAGLRPYDVVLAILNSEEARAILEDVMRRLKDVLPAVSRATITYLLY